MRGGERERERVWVKRGGKGKEKEGVKRERE